MISLRRYSETGLRAAAVPRSAFTSRSQHLRRLLAAARDDAGLTQAALAKKLGRHQSFVSTFEAGEGRLDVIESLEVARALGVDAHHIIRQLERI
jgi:transcriptional regulator with XRE-family HTH domain